MFNFVMAVFILSLAAQAEEGAKLLFRWVVLGIAYCLLYCIKGAEWVNKKVKALWNGLF